MFFLWKKTKNGEKKESGRKSDRISRLASYLRAKRESSIIVRTGFPTSVADLVVNSNIGLFPLQSKQKKSKKLLRLSSEENESVSSQSLNSRPVRVSSHKSKPDLLHLSDESSFPLIKEESADVVRSREDFVSVSNGAFSSIVKILFLVILALGTKKLALGITVSAFSLFFLEFAGKRVLIFLKPCATVRQSFKLGFWRENKVTDFKHDQVLQSNADLVDFVALDPRSDSNLEAEDSEDLRSGIKEIQIPASDLDWSDFKVMNQNMDIPVKDMDLEVKTMGLRKSQSQRARIKAKFKKLVRGKFHRVKFGRSYSSVVESQQGDARSFCRDLILDCKEGEEEEVGEEDVQIFDSIPQNSSQDITVSGKNVCRKTKGCSAERLMSRTIGAPNHGRFLEDRQPVNEGYYTYTSKAEIMPGKHLEGPRFPNMQAFFNRKNAYEEYEYDNRVEEQKKISPVSVEHVEEQRKKSHPAFVEHVEEQRKISHPAFVEHVEEERKISSPTFVEHVEEQKKISSPAFVERVVQTNERVQSIGFQPKKHVKEVKHHNYDENIDTEAEEFIKKKHRYLEMDKLMSMKKV